VWVVFLAFRRFLTVPVAPARLVAAYVIGSISMLWFVARISAFGA
jgi:hypothetical protein